MNKQCKKCLIDQPLDDYTKPLEVRWLCDLHHKEHHNRLREMERAA